MAKNSTSSFDVWKHRTQLRQNVFLFSYVKQSPQQSTHRIQHNTITILRHVITNNNPKNLFTKNPYPPPTHGNVYFQQTIGRHNRNNIR